MVSKQHKFLGKKNISFASNGEWKKKTFASELRQLHDTHSLNWDPPWRRKEKNFESKYHDTKLKRL